jgi:hypothetical protein
MKLHHGFPTITMGHKLIGVTPVAKLIELIGIPPMARPRTMLIGLHLLHTRN